MATICALMALPFGGVSLIWALRGGYLGLFVFMWRLVPA